MIGSRFIREAKKNRRLAEQMGIKAKQEHLWFLSKLNLDRYKLFLQDLVRRFSMDRFIQDLSVEQQLIQSKQSTLKVMEPGYIVQRGFSILRDETGNIVSSVKNIQKGSIIHASVRDGKIVGYSEFSYGRRKVTEEAPEYKN